MIREVLVKGYLRKAPSSPQRPKNHGLNIFCTGCNVLLEPRWKKRFCIFYKIRNTTETQIFFEYYHKESDKNPRGCVDLNSCDCIYEQKVGNQLPNVFVVQTTYRGKRRDYLFSANTPEEMNEWITQLTKVLHMVPEQVSGPAAGGTVRADYFFIPRIAVEFITVNIRYGQKEILFRPQFIPHFAFCRGNLGSGNRSTFQRASWIKSGISKHPY
ncbi:hypothetical protein ACTXT7_004111 [Hymenolepis weldensis]